MSTTLGSAGVESRLRPEIWRGSSGEMVPGVDVARHLEATRDLLEARGWTRVMRRDEDGPDETSTVKALLLWLVGQAVGGLGPLTLWEGLVEVPEVDGDDDSRRVAVALLRAVLEARTGAKYASEDAWAGRRGRTWDEVRDLLDEAAEAARRHGPEAA